MPHEFDVLDLNLLLLIGALLALAVFWLWMVYRKHAAVDALARTSETDLAAECRWVEARLFSLDRKLIGLRERALFGRLTVAERRELAQLEAKRRTLSSRLEFLRALAAPPVTASTERKAS